MTLRALTLWRPWTDVILRAPADIAKRVENRPWACPSALIGKRIALHAGKTYDEDGAESIALRLMGTGTSWHVPEDEESPQGIVGVARVVGVRGPRHVEFAWSCANGRARSTRSLDAPGLFAASDEEGRRIEARLLDLHNDRWWIGPYGWLLDEVVAIDPILYKGARSLWVVDPEIEAEVERRVRDALIKRADAAVDRAIARWVAP